MTKFIILFTILSWVLYLIVMSLYRINERSPFTGWQKWLAYTFVGICYVIDVFYNVIVGSWLFMELPHEFTFTKRCNRHIRYGKGWRHKLAVFLCKYLLDPFAPEGKHCKKVKL